MSWMDDHYRMDNEGNFETLEDYNRAVKMVIWKSYLMVVITTEKAIQSMIPEATRSEITDQQSGINN